MPKPHPSDWLFAHFGRRPGHLMLLITLACRLPARWDAGQESAFRDRVILLVVAMLGITQDIAILRKITAFRQRFDAADSDTIKRAAVYLIFLARPDYDWPETVEWDADAGRPRIQDINGMLEHAEGLVLELLAIRLRRARDDQNDGDKS